MGKARFKKYIYKYKYLLEEIKEHDAFFKEKIDEWNELFGEFNVNEPDKHTDCGTDNCCQNCEPENKEDKHPHIKKLYRKLVRYFHPDKGGDQNIFNKVKEAYEENDMIGMFLIAEENNIDVELTDNMETVMERSVYNLQVKEQNKNKTLLALFFKGSDEDKANVIRMLEMRHGKVLNEDIRKKFIKE
jgi:hypothetical protein